ncbi:MAG TPA: MGMT family protein, partial [Alphaproteobacteria bacterium]
MKIRVQKTPPSKLLCGPASTPDGDAVVALTEKGELCRMSLLQDRDLVDVIEAWQYEWSKTFFTVGVIPKNFLKLPILMIGTDVQKKIWSTIMRIPRGKVLSYGEVAAKAGLPRAAR